MNSAAKKLAIVTGAFIILTSAGGLAWAGQVGALTTFSSGTTAKASEVNGNFSAVTTAVDDNDTRITAVIANTQAGALKTAVDANTAATATNTTAITAINGADTTQTTDINNLKGNWMGSLAASCRDNTGAVDSNAVRVGPLCVDKFRARLTIGSCAADGTGAGCNSVVAQSTATGTAANAISWAQAARACANAGKRLLTPGEWMMANTVGTVSEMTAQEWVDSVSSVLTASFTYPAGSYPASTIQNAQVAPSATAVQVGHMGPISGTIEFFADADYTDTTTGFTFRCVR